MTTNILAFGIAKEICGGSSVSIAWEGGTVSSLKEKMVLMYPGLARITSFALAVNGEYASPAATVQAGDEVAIIPPVSGG